MGGMEGHHLVSGATCQDLERLADIQGHRDGRRAGDNHRVEHHAREQRADREFPRSVLRSMYSLIDPVAKGTAAAEAELLGRVCAPGRSPRLATNKPR